MITLYLAAFFAALAITLATTPVARRLAIRFDLVDRPAARKLHIDPVPQLGGVAIILSFSLAVATGAALLGRPASYAPLAAVLGGGVALGILGLWDDLRVVPGWVKVPTELALGIVLYVSGSRAELFGVWPLDLTLTLAWVIGVTNAVNYMDNMDGLSAGVTGIAAGYFTFLAAMSDQFLVASLAAALGGCAVGFLWHNRPPAKIFMGDAGSLFFGFLLAGLGLELRFDNIERVTFFVPAAVMAVPILDALMVSLSRVLKGLSPIHPGKDHISHRLVATGLSPRSAVALLWFASAASGWLGVTIARAQPGTAYMLMGWMVAVAIFFGVLLLRVDTDTVLRRAGDAP